MKNAATRMETAPVQGKGQRMPDHTSVVLVKVERLNFDTRDIFIPAVVERLYKLAINVLESK
jgi:hypothetical protein